MSLTQEEPAIYSTVQALLENKMASIKSHVRISAHSWLPLKSSCSLTAFVREHQSWQIHVNALL